MAGRGEEEEEEEEAADTQLHHPCHPHPLFPGYYGDRSFGPTCDLCHYLIGDDGYSCTTCGFYTHKQCAEAPPLIPRHPFHPLHPLSLSHDRPFFICKVCHAGHERFISFGCDECGFFLDVRCALFPLPDPEGSSEEQIENPIHDHPLISLLDDGRYICKYECTICHGRILIEEEEADAYMCVHPRCEFLIHKRCIQDLYYEDGSRVPRVYHRHELATFSAAEGQSIPCRNCPSYVSSGDYFGCKTCKVFYHRDCVKFPETIQYPLHPDHGSLVLFICPRDDRVKCQSCSYSVLDELCYRCFDCNFALHTQCGLQTLLYREEGMAVDIVLPWHEHPLILCHRIDMSWDMCSCCFEDLNGPAYRCKEEDCRIVLHEGCTEQSSEINHPHHPEHPLVLLATFKELRPSCDACREETFPLRFSCELRRFYLHIGCASQFPTQKHYLHEHDLVRFERIPSLKCNRCGTSTDSPFLRCVSCDFNLHEKCTELPRVVKHKTHRHSLTLRDFFKEDDTGEYYCDLCEQRRDGRLGVYMCLACKMDRPWTFHIECILPELRKVNVKKVRDSALKECVKEVAKKEERLRALEKEVEETTRELEELKKRLAELSLLKAQGEEE